MKLLIAVKSCMRDWMAGHHEVIRKTWGQDAYPLADLQFFYGDGAGWMLGSDFDEQHLQVPDNYLSLPYKTKAICSWSLIREYDYTFLCDTDTYTIPSKLVRSGFEKYDYSGRFGRQPAVGTTFHYRDQYGDYPLCHPWASGGVGYFLSKKAAEVIAINTPNVWAEDMFVGQCIGPHVQAGTLTASDIPIECESAWHFPRRSYNNESYDLKYGWMEKMYNDYR